MQQLRTYRLVPALLALTLVLTAATPLVRYSCGMSAMEMAAMPCHGGESEHQDAPAMPMHGDIADAAMPCHEASAVDAPATPPPCPDGATLHDTCCVTADAPAAPVPERVELSPTALAALVAAFLQPPPAAPAAPRSPSADPPPPAPVALHLLYGTFLT